MGVGRMFSTNRTYAMTNRVPVVIAEVFLVILGEIGVGGSEMKGRC
jgi:hypothetical protein